MPLVHKINIKISLQLQWDLFLLILAKMCGFNLTEVFHCIYNDKNV